ncbi:MAG: hypothetical protein ACRECV_06105 [Xanthobacteraceae bacterium]
MASEGQTKRILDEHTDALAKLPNVVGLGIQHAENDPHSPVVAVYVSTKVPEAKLKPSEVVPPSLSSLISGERVEAPTRVIEVGDVRPQ